MHHHCLYDALFLVIIWYIFFNSGGRDWIGIYQIILISIYSWFKICLLLAIKELSSIVVKKFHNDKIYVPLSHLPNAENYACTFLIWAIKCQYTDIYGYVKIMFAIWAFNETLQKISNDIQQILSTNIWHMNHYNEGLG